MMGRVPVYPVDRTTLVPPEGRVWYNQLPPPPATCRGSQSHRAQNRARTRPKKCFLHERENGVPESVVSTTEMTSVTTPEAQGLLNAEKSAFAAQDRAPGGSRLEWGRAAPDVGGGRLSRSVGAEEASSGPNVV